MQNIMTVSIILFGLGEVALNMSDSNLTEKMSSIEVDFFISKLSIISVKCFRST